MPRPRVTLHHMNLKNHIHEIRQHANDGRVWVVDCLCVVSSCLWMCSAIINICYSVLGKRATLTEADCATRHGILNEDWICGTGTREGKMKCTFSCRHLSHTVPSRRVAVAWLVTDRTV